MIASILHFLTSVAMLGQLPAGSPPAAPPLGTMSDTLTEQPYIDGSYGFTVRSPAGWQVNRTRVRDGTAVTLLEMIERMPPTLEHSISVQRTSAPEEKTETVLKRFFDALGEDFNDVKAEAARPRTIAGRPGAERVATYMAEGARAVRFQAAVEVHPRQYLMLVYQGPEGLRNKSEPLFERVLDTFTLIPDAYDPEQLRAAGAEGFLWVKGVGGLSIRKAILPEVYFRIDVAGKTIGFMGVAESLAEHDRHEGIEVRERYWTFAADGTAQRIQANEFISMDLRHEDWKTSTTTLVPRRGDQPARLLASLEDAVRVDDVLLSNQTYSLDEPSTGNPPYHLPPTYMPRVAARMLPRLTSRLDNPRLMAMAVFDPARSDVVMQIVELKGEEAAPGVSASTATYRIDQREGPASAPTTTYVDENGAVLLVKAGPMTMRPATRQEMERQFGPRIAAAEKTMSELEKQYRDEGERFSRQTDGPPVISSGKDFNKPRERPPPRPKLPIAPKPRKPEGPTRPGQGK